MALSIEYEVNGRNVSRDLFMRAMQNDFQRKVAEGVTKAVTEYLSGVTCGVHDLGPTIVMLEREGANASFQVRGLCCGDLREKVQEALLPLRRPPNV